MKALLLIAGQSSRFWPLTDKSFFPICGKTLLQHQVERLKKGGCEDIVLVGGTHNLQEARLSFPDLQIIEQERLDLGMRGALLSALPHVLNEPVMVVGGNDIVDPSGFISLVESAKGVGVDGAILAQKVERYFPGGYLKIEGDRITSITEKPGEGREPSNLVNIVAHIHKNPHTLLQALQGIGNSRDDGYEQALDALFRKFIYCAVPYEGTWRPVKYPWHLLELLPILLNNTEQHTHPNATIHPSAVVEGNVTLSEGVRVLPHATIVGPCFIGKNCMIATNALVRESSIGEENVIGFGSEITRSIFSKNTWTHFSYVGDSILGKNVALGAGSITGNLRLDEEVVSSYVKGRQIQTELRKFGTVIGDNVRLGIHTGTNPGVKIGRDSFIRSGTIISEDVPDGSYVQVKEGGMVIIPNKKLPLSVRV